MAVRMTPQPMRPGRNFDRSYSTESTHIGWNTLLALLLLLLMAPLATWGRVHVHTPNGDGPCDTNGTTNQPGIANNLLTSCESAPREGPVRLAAELGTPTAEAVGYDAFLDGDLNVYENYIHSDGPCDTNGTTNQPGIANNLLTSCESAPREGPVRLAAELGTPTAEAAGYDAFLDDDCISLLSLEFPCHSFGPGTTRLRMQSTGFDYSRPRVASFA